MFTIRAERAADGPAIETLLDQAFGAKRHDRVSYRYRDGVPAVAALSHVACSPRGFILGTIRYWPVAVGPRSCPALLLGPLAVTGAAQGRGLGAALVRYTLSTAAATGHKRVLLVGDLTYYRQFGFAPVASLDIAMPDEKPGRLLGLELTSGALHAVTGEVRRWRSVRLGESVLRAA
jgi:predicted N-acetyltransferase YhbS